ncbi:alpha/beta fold hydrolase [Acinetobacter sp. 1000160]|uniref:alpha/beta hydrolase family protein n=1 Tax=Acinetobacter sp. 1000160 TaxID=1310800 RepID=UPI00044AA680|nr:alpha/beta fold hydrolase [Acinetobacter sp. 1000160]EXB46920.1 dienelactone hydrolase family protein [Acinetobacter baumannii 146457]EYT24115.1 dienelactone hydrolase family protein [Acinetobacter sp. 1000160]
MNSVESFWISCKDGYQLAAQFYPALNSDKSYPILICPATGITKNFYHAFAQWLNQQGYPVLSFDFRGIGESLHGALKDSTASINDWGMYDIPAAIEALLNRTQAEKVIIVGHSAGGQLLGIASNYHKVAKVLAIAGSTGHVKGLKGKTKVLAPVMFNVIFPVSSLVKGYGATQFIGMGENLPKNVAKQWAEFCSKPGYVMNAIGKTIFEDYHQQIQCPITSFWATDDEIATHSNVKDLLRLYPNAQTKLIELNPQQLGYKRIGHMLMFKKSHQKIWPILESELRI